MKRSAEGDAFTGIVTRALLLAALLEQAGESMAGPAGQSGARWRVLGVISKQAMTVAEVARSLHVSRQGIQRIADALTQEGLTRYLDNPGDQRANLLALTRQGQEVLAAIQSRQRRWANHLGEQLGMRQMAEIEASLQRLIDLLAD